MKPKPNQIELVEILVGKAHNFASIQDVMEGFENLIRNELEEICSELEVVADRRFTIGDEAIVVEVTCDGKRFEAEITLAISAEITDVREAD
jgi:predicted HAD superfamily phosphohydrolase